MMVINGKKVDVSSLEIENVNFEDYPKFCDARFSYGKFEDGMRLSDYELELMTDRYGEIVNEMAHESMHI